MPVRHKVFVRRLSQRTLRIDIPYHPAFVRMMRSLPERKWVERGKYWTVPSTVESVNRIQQMFSGQDLILDPVVPGAGPAYTAEHQPVTSKPRRSSLNDRRLAPRSPASERREIDFTEFLEHQMRLRKFSKQRIELYRNLLLEFTSGFNRHPRRVSGTEVLHYLSHIVSVRKVTPDYFFRIVEALRFLYGTLYGRQLLDRQLELIRHTRKFPPVIPTRSN